MAELIHLRIDSKIRKQMKETVKENLFSNESEFIRDSIRKNLENYEKMKTLKKIQNTIPERKNKPNKKTSSELFREIGLE